MFLLNFSVILGHSKFASCLGGAQRVLVGSCKVLAMHLNVYAGVTIKTKTCPIGHLKTVCNAGDCCCCEENNKRVTWLCVHYGLLCIISWASSNCDDCGQSIAHFTPLSAPSASHLMNCNFGEDFSWKEANLFSLFGYHASHPINAIQSQSDWSRA